MQTEYTLKTIWGDYGVRVPDDGIENKVAPALLPPEVFEGDRIVCDGMDYAIIR